MPGQAVLNLEEQRIPQPPLSFPESLSVPPALPRRHTTTAQEPRWEARRLLTMITAALVLASFGCDRRISANRLVERNARVYAGSESQPYSGTAYELHRNGKLKAETPYRDGRVQGTLHRWFENGVPSQTCDYSDNLRSGRCRTFHPDGSLSTDTTFRKGLPDGSDKEWFQNGRLKVDGTYRDAKRTGPYRLWFEDGSPRFECNYVDGRMDGLCREWYRAGRLAWQAMFARGAFAGEVRSWRVSGERHLETTAHGDTPDGSWLKWHPNGALRQRGTWRDGRLDGVWEEWDEQGHRLERAEYRSGERVSLRQWYPNGNRRFAAKRSGAKGGWSWEAWDSNGHPPQEAVLLHGLYPFLFTPRVPRPTKAPELTETQRQSLASLRHIRDQVLDEMQFVGDYGFEEYLARGKPGLWTGLPELTRTPFPDEEEQECSTAVTTNRSGETIFGHNNDSKKWRLLMLHTAPPAAHASISVVMVPTMGDPEGVDSLFPWTDGLLYLRAPFYPIVGMNDHGVAVAGMSSEGQEPAFDPRRATLSYTQMIRLILDYAGTVEEAVELVQAYNWEHYHDHLLIADRTGLSVVVELVDDRVVTIPAQNRWQAATNFRLTGRAPEQWHGLCWRFDRLTAGLTARSGDLDAEAMLQLMASVSMEETLETSVSAVFNLNTGDLLLAAHRDYAHPFNFRLPTAQPQRIR